MVDFGTLMKIWPTCKYSKMELACNKMKFWPTWIWVTKIPTQPTISTSSSSKIFRMQQRAFRGRGTWGLVYWSIWWFVGLLVHCWVWLFFFCCRFTEDLFLYVISFRATPTTLMSEPDGLNLTTTAVSRVFVDQWIIRLMDGQKDGRKDGRTNRLTDRPTQQGVESRVCD